MFTSSDRREIQEIKISLSQLRDRLDIHAQLVELNAGLKQLLEEQSSQAEVDALTDRVTKQAAEFEVPENTES